MKTKYFINKNFSYTTIGKHYYWVSDGKIFFKRDDGTRLESVSYKNISELIERGYKEIPPSELVFLI